MKKSPLVLSLLALALPALVAHAQSSPARVAVVLPACKPSSLDQASLLSLLAIELRSDGVEQVSDAVDSPVATLRIEQPACDQPRMLLVLEDRLTGKTAGRSVELSAIEPGARARFLALSSAELIRASWLELLSLRPSAVDPLTRAVRARVAALASSGASLPPPPASTSAPAPAIPAPASAPPAPPVPSSSAPAGGSLEPYKPRDPAMSFGGLVRSHPSARAGLVGLWIGGRVALSPAAALWFEARGADGSARDALGTVRLRQGTAALSLVHVARGVRMRARMGPMVELGVARASGEDPIASVEASSRTQLLATLGARAEVEGLMSPGWSWLAGVEGGATVAGVTALADQRAVVGLTGPWMGLSLGLGARP